MRELSLHILDLAQNSLTAGASRLDIIVEIDHKKDLVAITLSDDGKGMAPDFLKTVTSPFTTTRTTRKVGLGIPMFKENAELTGGTFSIESTVGVGTKMRAGFVLSTAGRSGRDDDLAGRIQSRISFSSRLSGRRTVLFLRYRGDQSRPGSCPAGQPGGRLLDEGLSRRRYRIFTRRCVIL